MTTRARAQAMILAGHVLVDDAPIDKAGTLIAEDSHLRLKEPELKYVSRGALKLKSALEKFKIKAEGKTAIDIGASTGGFTEVLLEEGAAVVHAVDVGTNQLAWKIRSDPRVIVRENYNARHLNSKDFDVEFELLVMDVSFISIQLIIPSVLPILKKGAELVVLFKPQFEVGREQVGDGGIVRNQEHALQVLSDRIEWAKDLGLEFKDQMDSPIYGTDGNKEYLIHWQKK